LRWIKHLHIIYLYGFLSGFTCAGLSIPLNFHFTSHKYKYYMMVVATASIELFMEPVTDSFEAMKWLFWNLGPSLNGLHDQLTTIPGWQGRKKLCLSVSHHFTSMVSFHDIHLSFIPSPFFLCVSVRVCYARAFFCMPLLGTAC
jgi:hypothetical protein